MIVIVQFGPGDLLPSVEVLKVIILEVVENEFFVLLRWDILGRSFMTGIQQSTLTSHFIIFCDLNNFNIKSARFLKSHHRRKVKRSRSTFYWIILLREHAMDKRRVPHISTDTLSSLFSSFLRVHN